MLKISGSTESKTRPGEGKVGVGSNSRARRDGSEDRINDSEVDGGEVGDDEIGKKVQKSSKSKKR